MYPREHKTTSSSNNSNQLFSSKCQAASSLCFYVMCNVNLQYTFCSYRTQTLFRCKVYSLLYIYVYICVIIFLQQQSVQCVYNTYVFSFHPTLDPATQHIFNIAKYISDQEKERARIILQLVCPFKSRFFFIFKNLSHLLSE